MDKSEKKKLINYLKTKIDDKRLKHSVNTAKEAVYLAKKYNSDPDKAYLAGLLHDVAKGLSGADLENTANQYGIEIDEYEVVNPELIHGKIGAVMVNKQLGIEDKDILGAIRWHTTGHKNMTLLEKIIYLADIIEPGRKFLHVNIIKRLAYQDIDQAMVFALEHIFEFVKSKGFSLHPESIEAYHFLKRTGGI